MRNLPGICHLPNQLYKFYRFDPQYNESRLKGEIYLANALQFNDPLDCRIDVLNNTKDKAPEFYLLYEQQLTDIPVYRMYKNNQQGLSKVEVDLSRLKHSFAKIDMEMDSVFEAHNCSQD